MVEGRFLGDWKGMEDEGSLNSGARGGLNIIKMCYAYVQISKINVMFMYCKYVLINPKQFSKEKKLTLR